MPYKDPVKAKQSQKERSAKYRSRHRETINAKLRERAASGYHKRRYATEQGKRSAKSRTLKVFYGIDIDQWEEIIASQNGMCALCGDPLDVDGKLTALSPVVDHDHKCCNGAKSCGDCIRGIIHRCCNAGLGLFGDDASRLLMAFEYLEKYR